jgi:hypothetical protein
LTSSARARRFGLPYFSLKRVAHIRAWLALRNGRGWLRRFRHQRETDAVVALCFYALLALAAAAIAVAVRGPKTKSKTNTRAQKHGVAS